MPRARREYRGQWNDGRPPARGCPTENDYVADGRICDRVWRGWCCTRTPGHTGDHVGHYSAREVCARWAPTESDQRVSR